MYSILCRLFHQLHNYPRRVLIVSAFITLAAGYFALKLEVRFSLTDVLPQDFASVRTLARVEEKFGGIGKLSVIFTSEDSGLSKAAVLAFTAVMEKHPDINIVDYRNETDFLFKNRLLYIELDDLEEIEKRIETGFWTKKKKYNPLLVDLLNEDEKALTEESNLTFEDLQRKYQPELREFYGSDDGKTLIVHLFPLFDISDTRKCQAFHDDVADVISRLPETAQVSTMITGEVMVSIQEEGRLLSEVMDSGWLSLATLIVLLFIFFFRVPAGPLLVLIPMSMGIIWTMALTYFFIGYLNMITLSLGIILLGLGLDAALHLLSRYTEERRKQLSAQIAFETIILETGPAVTMGAMTTAAAFFSITITDFKGFSEFGLIAGMGVICTLVAILLVFPCLLIIMEPLKAVHVFGSRIYNHNQFCRRPYAGWKHHIWLLLLVTAGLCFKGFQNRFEFDFDRLGFPNQNAAADSILLASGAAIGSPAVVITPNQTEAARIAEYFRKYQKADTLSPTIYSVMSLSNLLPDRQEEKLKIITHLRKMVTPGIIQNAGEPLKSRLLQLQDAWDVTLITLADLPAGFRKKFMGRDGRPGNFTFIFPAVDIRNGLNCMAFAEDTRRIELNDGTEYYSSGVAVIYADLLSLMIPDTIKAVLLSLVTVFLLVLLQTRSVRGTLVLFVPILLAIGWTAGVMKLAGIKLNYYNLIVLPAMIGIGIDNSVHLYHRYIEEGRGSIFFVLRRTGSIISAGSLTTVAGFFGLLFSSHRGLFSMGITAAIGIGLTLAASMLFVPIILGYFDTRDP